MAAPRQSAFRPLESPRIRLRPVICAHILILHYVRAVPLAAVQRCKSVEDGARRLGRNKAGAVVACISLRKDRLQGAKAELMPKTGGEKLHRAGPSSSAKPLSDQSWPGWPWSWFGPASRADCSSECFFKHQLFRVGTLEWRGQHCLSKRRSACRADPRVEGKVAWRCSARPR